MPLTALEAENTWRVQCEYTVPECALGIRKEHILKCEQWWSGLWHNNDIPSQVGPHQREVWLLTDGKEMLGRWRSLQERWRYRCRGGSWSRSTDRGLTPQLQFWTQHALGVPGWPRCPAVMLGAPLLLAGGAFSFLTGVRAAQQWGLWGQRVWERRGWSFESDRPGMEWEASPF